MTKTSSLNNISTQLLRIATLAKAAPEMRFTTLAHHLNKELLEQSFRRTRKTGAPGVDQETGVEYGEQLSERLDNLIARLKDRRYRAPPVRRVYIPKGDGTTRPLGLPTFEDKVLQRAVATILEAIYEQDFLPCSYGFRPGRSAHDALDELWHKTMAVHGGWLIELDIQAYFENISHANLLEVIRKRVGDGLILRLIGKWLNAGVLEDGNIRRRSSGAPQGGVISPLLSNIYLHEVLDEWFEDVVKPRIRGEASLVRYADDAVVIFEREEDARRVLAVLAKRFAKYGLTLHPEKTKMTDFRRPPYTGKRRRGMSFDFLGFTHFWARSRKGTWVMRPKTATKRLGRVVKGLNEWCKWHRHDALDEQHQQLVRKLKGHYGYFGRIGNGGSLSAVYRHTVRIWWKWLNRRSNRARMDWAKFSRKVLQRFPLPAARVTRSVYVTAAKP